LSKRNWSFDSLVLIFSFIVIAQILGYVIPQGQFEREPYPDNPSRSMVIPETYTVSAPEQQISMPPYYFLTAIPKGFEAAQEFSILGGRLDADKTWELYQQFCVELDPTAVFICGPDTMIATVTEVLSKLGIDDSAIYAERFGAVRKRKGPQGSIEVATDTGKRVKVSVILDGHRQSFDMPAEGTSILDAAADHGIELPYSCKGGVCATCRTHLREGEVRMETNYGLEPWELEQGFVLVCQSHPLTESVVLDYDKT